MLWDRGKEKCEPFGFRGWGLQVYDAGCRESCLLDFRLKGNKIMDNSKTNSKTTATNNNNTRTDSRTIRNCEASHHRP